MNHLGTKRIETERLILRPFVVEDAPAMFKNWAGDPEVTAFMTWPTHASEEHTAALLSEWAAGYDNDKKYEWCLEYKETGEAIGSLGVAHINEKAASIEIGYCIGKAYWHQGITSEAASAVIRFLMDEVGANRIEARHDPRNVNSGRVMKKCGMIYEGTRIQADWNNQGVCDAALYGLVKNRAGEEKLPAGIMETAAERISEKNTISDETIEYVGILAKLSLSEEEKEQAKQDMGNMLDYIDKLNELDTEGVEPMSHIFPIENVFREDVAENTGSRESILKNAPAQKDGSFKVPKTVE